MRDAGMLNVDLGTSFTFETGHMVYTKCYRGLMILPTRASRIPNGSLPK